MSKQNSNAVAMTGGTATGLSTLTCTEFQADGNTLVVSPTTHRVGIGNFSPTQLLDVNGHTRILGEMGLGAGPNGFCRLYLEHPKNSRYGLTTRTTDNDAGGFPTMTFNNASGAQVGSINATASATAYNTSSDARLKFAISTLTGALERVQALRPVSFKWQADDSPGVGYLAHELQQIIPEAVTGLPDEVNDDGTIKPQQVDHSKLIPHLTAGLQELLALVDSLTARVASLEEALGL